MLKLNLIFNLSYNNHRTPSNSKLIKAKIYPNFYD